MSRKTSTDRGGPMPFGSQHIVADCFSTEKLLDHFRATVPKFDVVSCQFALHYCFEVSIHPSIHPSIHHDVL